jgi:hypothetical protein
MSPLDESERPNRQLVMGLEQEIFIVLNYGQHVGPVKASGSLAPQTEFDSTLAFVRIKCCLLRWSFMYNTDLPLSAALERQWSG